MKEVTPGVIFLDNQQGSKYWHRSITTVSLILHDNHGKNGWEGWLLIIDALVTDRNGTVVSNYNMNLVYPV